MIKNNRIDFPAWISLCVLIFLGVFAELNHFLFSEYPIWKIVFFATSVIILCFCAGLLRNLFPRITDWAFASILTAYLYRLWPHMFFDDAGFIMRYLDQLKDGYWFQYNGGEGAVFGISGFIHGLYCSLLVKFGGMSPERALHFSNLTGLAITIYFISGIFRYFIQRPGIAYASTFVIVCFSKTWADVLFTGMETPLHVALVMGAFYFLLFGKIRAFYLFASLSVISKLDAVPIMAVLLLFHAIDNIKKFGIAKTIQVNIKPQLVYFWVPLLIWFGFSTWLFGSPFPQSAKAKVLYHSGANNSLFPFLEGFSNDIYKHPILWLLLVLFVLHVLYINRKGLQAITIYFGFGWMFVGIMAMYYFYNPNERMLWYYALPETLLLAQCILSTVWIASESKDWKKYLLPVLVLFCWVLYLKPDVDGGRNWMFSYLEKVERERYEVGKYIASQATDQDTLLAWHGLIARPFPGFVLDGTGLNSKMAVEFKLNRDSMISVIKPDYGIHHGYPAINESFSKNGYFIKGMFGDVTLENWPAWIWWERNTSRMPNTITQTVTDSMIVSGRIMNKENPIKVEGRSVIFQLPENVNKGVFWCVFEGRGNNDKNVHIKLWGGTELITEWDIKLPPYGKEGYPSLYTYGSGFSFGNDYRSYTDSSQVRVEFLPTGEDTVVKINNPIIEYPHK